MSLSIPKPTSAIEPARAPATMATIPSTTFQPTVKYSSLSARCRRPLSYQTVA
jgi:hypothetical protein